MTKEFILMTWGGIGDVLICTPAIKALKLAHPHAKIIVYHAAMNKAHRCVFANNPYIESVRELNVLTLLRHPYHLYLYLSKKYEKRHFFLHFQHVPPTWIYKKHNKEVAADMFNVKLQDDKVQLFFTAREEENARKMLAPFSNVVIMHIHSKTSKNHQWPIAKWEELVRELPEYTFIQIGHLNEPAIKGAIDWRGKTGLRTAFCLLKYAASFVGVESCFAHATNAVGLPGVVLFGDTAPETWGHSNNINVYKGISCSPCFYYLWGSTCPYGNECMNLIEVQEVKQALIRQVCRRTSQVAASIN